MSVWRSTKRPGVLLSRTVYEERASLLGSPCIITKSSIFLCYLYDLYAYRAFDQLD